MATGYRKKAIPLPVRRQLAVRYGCPPGGRITVPCHYCPRLGHIAWMRNGNGSPSSWVHFGHEIDHVHPESAGGPTTAENLVLACQRCNRRKGVRV
jgi:5-methylcytosine-specific restriction endonuclease McrA